MLKITIPLEEYEELKERSDWLNILEQAGVDNWEGMSYAVQLFQEYKKIISKKINYNE